jgi:hypothetical protein
MRSVPARQWKVSIGPATLVANTVPWWRRHTEQWQNHMAVNGASYDQRTAPHTQAPLTRAEKTSGG